MSVDNTGGRERGWNDFMCERHDAMTPERLAHIEKDLATGGSAYDYVAELVGEIRELWIDKDSMIPMEQC